MIVPPRGMMPAIRRRSSSTCFPGGSKPSKPSRNPRTSQPSFSAARTTPRNTAFKPGQSPPLVRTPIRGLVIAADAGSKSFVRIDHAPASGPLIVKLPAAAEKLRAFAEAIGAAENHDDQMARNDRSPGAFLDHLRFALGRKNEAIARARRAPRLHTIHAIPAEKFVRVPQHVSDLFAAAIETDLAFLLRNIE